MWLCSGEFNGQYIFCLLFLFSELEEVTRRTKEKVNAGLLHKVLLEVTWKLYARYINMMEDTVCDAGMHCI